jgi:hypothetical protein
MFVGHYSVSFALNNRRDRIPLWVLFIAVQLVDILWAIFILLGIEKVRIVPGITATSPLDLYYMPYTHSLLGAIGWSGVAFVSYRLAAGSKASNSSALIVALAVFSHWILDLIVHRPDLSIYGDTLKVGLGLWDYKYLAFVLEMSILVVGIMLYVKRNKGISRGRRYGMLTFGSFMILIQSMGTFMGRPISSDRTIATTNLVLYILFAGVAFLLERQRKVAA